MPSRNESLILRERAEIQAQPFLFLEEQLPPKIDREKPKFHCTGERFWRDHPDDYKRLVKALAEPCVSTQSICDAFGVTDDLVRSVKARENIPIADEKKALLSNITHGARLASERVIATIPDASIRDAWISLGILVEKMQLLSGEVTACVEHRDRIDIFSDFTLENFSRNFVKPAQAREIDSSARQPSPQFEAVVKHLERLENGEEMGESAENNLQKGNGAENPVLAIEYGPETAATSVTNSESAGNSAEPSSTLDRRARWRARNRKRLREQNREYMRKQREAENVRQDL